MAVHMAVNSKPASPIYLQYLVYIYCGEGLS